MLSMSRECKFNLYYLKKNNSITKYSTSLQMLVSRKGKNRNSIGCTMIQIEKLNSSMIKLNRWNFRIKY